ncbi:MAG: glycine cleavage system aminomethyltransferase GcvT [Actinobacteria bacterium]|nr:glycine cleavage system aminomethyltransferase GcvT [Actinomycetota bacterium]MCL5887615.1 glycine cleavage system aminomethyltransferase GcvT [Actinomycetota bacterium]
MNNSLVFILSIVIALSPASAYAVNSDDPLSATSSSRGPSIDTPHEALLLVSENGHELWSKGADESRSIASITKIMTAIVVLDRANLDDSVMISAADIATGGSNANLRPGEIMTVRECLEALLLVSGNEVANALARHVAGSPEEFVAIMNDRALRLGMSDTRFANPHGIDQAGHYSTARDLAILARYAMQSDEIRRISALEFFDPDGSGPRPPEENTSLLVGEYLGATGLKTGWTSRAGFSLISSASRDGLELFAVILGTPSERARFVIAQQAMDWGFENLTYQRFVDRGQEFGSVRVTDYLDLTIPAVSNSAFSDYIFAPDGQVTAEVELVAHIEAPVAAGDRLGTLRLVQDDRLIYQTTLVSQVSVEKPGVFERVWIAIQRFFRPQEGQVPLATQVSKTPLYDEHIALGAQMTEFAGYLMPMQYMGIRQEHSAVREGCGIFDLCHMAQLRVCGASAFDFLQYLMTNDLSRLSVPGIAQYTLICDHDAGIIDDVIVYRTGDNEYLLVANAVNRYIVFDWANTIRDRWSLNESAGEGARKHGIDLDIIDETDRTGLIALQGPLAMRLLEHMTPKDTTFPARFSIAPSTVGNMPVLLSRTGYTGEDGVEIFTHESNTVAIWRYLLSFSEITPCGLGSRDTLRLEMGYHLYGSDMDRGVDPISARLGWVCPDKKHDFVGSEAIRRIREQGIERVLAFFTSTEGIPRQGMSISVKGIEIGRVASGTFSPSLSIGIASGYIPIEYAVAEQKLDLQVRRKHAPLIVVDPPFVHDTSLRQNNCRKENDESG